MAQRHARYNSGVISAGHDRPLNVGGADVAEDITNPDARLCDRPISPPDLAASEGLLVHRGPRVAPSPIRTVPRRQAERPYSASSGSLCSTILTAAQADPRSPGPHPAAPGTEIVPWSSPILRALLQEFGRPPRRRSHGAIEEPHLLRIPAPSAR